MVDTNNKEKWVKVPGFEGYEWSNRGRVRSNRNSGANGDFRLLNKHSKNLYRLCVGGVYYSVNTDWLNYVCGFSANSNIRQPVIIRGIHLEEAKNKDNKQSSNDIEYHLLNAYKGLYEDEKHRATFYFYLFVSMLFITLFVILYILFGIN